MELNNGSEFVGLLNEGAQRIAAEPPDGMIRSLFVQALCREPTLEEKAIALDLLRAGDQDVGKVDILWMVFMLPEFQIIN